MKHNTKVLDVVKKKDDLQLYIVWMFYGDEVILKYIDRKEFRVVKPEGFYEGWVATGETFLLRKEGS